MSVGHLPMRRTATFLAGLALNQNKPNIALEIIANTKQQNYMTVRNLKVIFQIFISRSLHYLNKIFKIERL